MGHLWLGKKGAGQYIKTFLVFYGDHNWKSLFLRVAAKISSGNSVENDGNVSDVHTCFSSVGLV